MKAKGTSRVRESRTGGCEHRKTCGKRVPARALERNFMNDERTQQVEFDKGTRRIKHGSNRRMKAKAKF